MYQNINAMCVLVFVSTYNNMHVNVMGACTFQSIKSSPRALVKRSTPNNGGEFERRNDIIIL